MEQQYRAHTHTHTGRERHTGERGRQAGRYSFVRKNSRSTHTLSHSLTHTHTHTNTQVGEMKPSRG